MPQPQRYVPLIIASPMFLQNIDGSSMSTALPSMAVSLGAPVLDLKLAITAYLLSIAVFLPLSGWLAERHGARRMFCVAIAIFSVASALCALAGSLPALIAARIGQGLGAAMMLPVGRIILMHSVPSSGMVQAMAWFTVPPVLGRLLGPLVGGAILTVASWHWIFLLHLPLGLLAIVLALRFVDEVPPAETPQPLDLPGYLLLACGLAAFIGSIEGAGAGLIAPVAAATAAACGALCLVAYAWRSRRVEHPLIDLRLLKVPTYRVNVLGAIPLRMSVFAVPFLLPLLLQVGFGLSPLLSGAVAAATGVGALCTRPFLRSALRQWGFRGLLLVGALGSGLITMSHALFLPTTSPWIMAACLLAGGLLGSLCMVTLNTLGFSDVPKPWHSQGSTLNSVVQQLTTGIAVVLAGWLVIGAAWVQGGTHPRWQDFSLAFVGVGALALLSLPAFLRLPKEAGNALR